VIGLMTLVAILCGCKAAQVAVSAGTDLMKDNKLINDKQQASIVNASDAVMKSAEPIQSEQEYYIGRAVAATLFTTYHPFDEAAANGYLNILGQSLAQYSDRPDLYLGYRFRILDSQEINAFATPGGHVLVTRGLIACCDSEDALAAVLAHEIAHIQNADGINAIKKGRLTSAVRLLATSAADEFGNENVKKLSSTLKGSVGDVCSTLVRVGYSKSQEFKADAGAITILRRAGYSPKALLAMLEEMGKRLKPGTHDFASTHPKPADRIANIRPMVESDAPPAAVAERQRRFREFRQGI